MISLKSILAKILTSIDNLNPTIQTYNGSATTVPNNTATTIAQITLSEAGTYIIIGSARFATANSVGYRQIRFSVNDAGASMDRFSGITVGTSPASEWLQVTIARKVEADTTIYLVAQHTAGTNLTVDTNGIKVVRIG